MNYSNKDRLQASVVRRVEEFVETQHGETRGEQNRQGVSWNVHQLKEKREYGLDNTLSDTFPCSDPLSSIPNPTSYPFGPSER
jgi:hypothetical protein